MIVVMCNGDFDMLHYGHILHLKAAREMGDILWVAMTDDLHVNKGPDRPVYPQEHRRAMLKELRCVDKVIIVSGLLEGLNIIKPSILVKGTDYRNGLHDIHEKYCAKHGIRIAYTDTPKLSATDMINEARNRSRL